MRNQSGANSSKAKMVIASTACLWAVASLCVTSVGESTSPVSSVALPATEGTPTATVSCGSLAGRRPNIILILSDDQGYGDLGRHENPVLKTPNLDRMYDEGRHFEDFHVSPTCSPTRCALMTGRHEFRNGVTHTIYERERLSLKATTIAQVLKSAGYTTGIFGKWHLGDEDAYQPDKRGFDEVFIHGGGGIGQTYPGSCGDAPGNTYFDPVIKHNGAFEKTHGFCTDVFFGRAMQWLGTVKDKQPFFLYLPSNAAHVPLSCPPEYEKLYKGKVSPEVATYFGMIANIDDNVGRLLAKLKQLGLDKQTLVIYMNDNGGFGPAVRIWNAGMRGGKATAFNGGARAMSLWRWPKAIKPAACNALTAHVDIFPTFCELAGVKTTTPLDGFSLVPLLDNPQTAWHDRMLFTHVGRWPKGESPRKYGTCSMRWQKHLQVREGNQWHLYDLTADAGEKTDIAARHPEVVAKLDAAYDVWWREVLPCLENEQAWKSAPQANPFKEQYWRQYRGAGPNNIPPPNREK